MTRTIVDEAKLATLLANVDDIGDFVRTTMTAKKRSLDERLLALRGVPATTLGSVVAAIGEAMTTPPKPKTVTKPPLFHHGDLVISKNVRLVTPMFVTGALRVDGVIDHVGPDSFAAIGGDLTCAHLWTSGEFSCGEIHAPAGIVYGYYNDNILACGTIDARIVIADEHDIQHAGVRAELYLDIDTYAQGYGRGVTKRLQTQLRDAYFKTDEDEGKLILDAYALFDALRRGERVFRARKGPAPKRRLRF